MISFINESKSIFRNFFPVSSNNGKVNISLINIKYKNNDHSNITNSSYDSPISLFALVKVNIYCSSDLLISKIIKIKILDIPPFTKSGSFLVNGIERTIISYLKKTPCLLFIKKTNSISLKIIPNKGIWLEFIYGNDGIINFCINKGTKLNIFTLLYSFGLCNNDILNHFNFVIKTMFFNKKLWFLLKPFQLKNIIGLYDIYSYSSSTIYRKHDTYNDINHIKLNKDYYHIPEIKENLVLFNSFKQNGYSFNKNEVLNLNKLKLASIGTKIYIYIYNIFSSRFSNLILKSFLCFSNSNTEHNKILVMRSFLNNSHNNESLLIRFNNTFFNKDYYELSHFLRNEINLKTSDFKSKSNTLEKNDVLRLVKYFARCIFMKKDTTDIDDISKKRTISVGEMLLDVVKSKLPYFRNFLLSKLPKIKHYSNNAIDIGFFSNDIREFFCTSQFSQFLDQNNILSEVTHKRRITFYNSLGSNNLRNLPIREIHVSNYGKICPVETPEGHNIGLVNSLSVFTKANKHCFLTSPYFKITNNNIDIRKIYYLSNHDEKKYNIASIDSFNNNNINNYNIRKDNRFHFMSNYSIDYCTISCIQLFSIAPLFIPFMENDDANRALMGSNMQRQAISSIRTEKPYVFTGLENIPPRNLNYIRRHSETDSLAYYDSIYILEFIKFKNVLIFKETILKKFQPSNQCNVINSRFINPELSINGNKVLIDSNDTSNGIISLGHNLLTAFIPFYGYNFEDSIVISEKIANSDMFCSIHSYDFSVNINKGNNYGEFINRDIFDIPKSNYNKLDKHGVIKVGSLVSYNDILVSKIRPVGKYENNPEDKLINTIFNNKENSFKKSYFRLPLHIKGIVIEINKYYNTSIVSSTSNKYTLPIYIKGKEVLKNAYIKLISIYKLKYNLDFIIRSRKIKFLSTNINRKALLYSIIINNRTSKIYSNTKKNRNSPLKLKKINIRIYSKKKLEVGDKMSGRHGNKGVISKILPIEDMPFLADGTPCDLILNPLGVPSRMNIGQLLEISLGFVIFLLNREFTRSKLMDLLKSSKISNMDFHEPNHNGFYFKSIPFEGLKYRDIVNITNMIVNKKLKKKYLIRDGKVKMYNGIYGDTFDSYICFGYMYFFKLNHLASDKIHARSIGPYSIITQQPLRGRSNLGGQRLGEMEVWALESYGASYILHEMLTIKSDDIVNRKRVYNDIFFNNFNFYSGIPESFNILINELKSLLITIEKV
ncbi:DNA-directed RNA polymerase subunit beta [Candidatus Vidania fulgoroideae]|uniref:DNA-directed RNA polymerase subunit beta n=1 Tax=Candidatus Vidania fulgoroideorum TaxID=881286 RepID=A0A974X9T0_9PROT|nr:DNA-directed RNA polymerase subunit beta [Candidatus Vidania fulgoroideae]